jgi:hypothetical protein
MISSHALIVMTVALAFFQASARPRGEADNDQPKMRSGIEIPFLKVGEPFLVARSRILQSGWQPTRMHSNDDYEYFGAEKELADRNFLEVDSCSMDAGALCILYYSKEKKCLRVDTVGERINEMTVTRWTDECPAGMQ